MTVVRRFVLLAALVVLAGCRGARNTPRAEAREELPYDAPGLTMPERLAKIAADARPGDLMFLNEERAARLRERLEAAGNDPRRILFLLLNYADELLNAGHPEEALREFARLEQILGEEDPKALARHHRW